LIEPGLHLGYRKRTSGPGTWVVRRYDGKKYTVKNLTTADDKLIVADDFSEADGNSILSFSQAQERAKAYRPAEGASLFTVADAMDLYLKFLEADGRSPQSISDVETRDAAFIRPKLGPIEVIALTTERLRRWRDELAKSAPRLRTRIGKSQRHRDVAGDDGRRARRSTANRIWTTLRAALNHAFNEGKAPSDLAWRKVKPFRGVDSARVRYLTLAEAKRLINASDPDFRLLVQAAFLTGGRYGQLTQLVASDFNPDASTVMMRTRKGDGSIRTHHVHLSDEGARFFESVCAGRAGTDMILTKSDGAPWKKSEQVRPIEEASKRARVTPSANFNVTRHTWASLSVMNGVPLMVVAKSLGHTDTRMVEKHYGHLAPSYIADAIRAGAPTFGITGTNAVTAIR
jgi:integrase